MDGAARFSLSSPHQGSGRGLLARSGRAGETGLGDVEPGAQDVAAQIKIESKTWNRFIMFQLQSLEPNAGNTSWGQPAPLYREPALGAAGSRRVEVEEAMVVPPSTAAVAATNATTAAGPAGTAGKDIRADTRAIRHVRPIPRLVLHRCVVAQVHFESKT